jgi:hypothetical protein
MNHFHILLPGGIAPPPILKRLVARSASETTVQIGLSSTLGRLFSVGHALAPHLLAAEDTAPEPGPWFRADPVHLLAGMHSVSLLDSRHFGLTADEAAALVAALNAHFGDEARFVAPHPGRWYVRFEPAIDALAPAIDELPGVPVVPDLIAGPDAARLHRFAMEAQMLLHGLAINEEREERGELPVNGLWFWGGGVPRTPAAAFDRVWADDFTARALARAAGIDRQALPKRFQPTTGRTLAVLDAGAEAERLDADWFAPILAALKWGKLDTLVLEAPGPDGFGVRLGRRQAWKLWER